MSIVSGLAQAQATNSAATTAAAAADRATQMQIEAAEPWTKAGRFSLNHLSQLMAAGPGGKTSALTYGKERPVVASAALPAKAIPSTGGGYWAYMDVAGEGGELKEIMRGGSDPNVIPKPMGGGTWQWVEPGQPGTPGSPAGTSPVETSNALMQFPDIPSDWGTDWESRYQESPYNKFLQEQGIKTMEQGAAARGKQFSGGQAKALQQYGQDIAGSGYQQWLTNWYNSLTPWQSMSGQGMTSSLQTGQGVANSLQNAGYAQAAGQMGVGNIAAKTIGNVGNNALQAYMYNKGGNQGYNAAAYGYGSGSPYASSPYGNYAAGEEAYVYLGGY